MRSSKKSKKKSRVRKSLSPVTGKAKARGGRSELHCLKRKGTGFVPLMQTETFQHECSSDCSPSARLVSAWLELSKAPFQVIKGKLYLFCQNSLYAFCLDSKSKLKRASNYSNGRLFLNGKRTAGCSTQKFYGSSSKEAIESAKYL